MKKSFLVVLCVVISIGMVNTTAAATKFSDVGSGSWYEEHVNVLVDKGIIAGYPDGAFKPNNQITVEQFIKTMIVALGYDLPNGTSRWSSTFIDKARDLGLIDDYEYTTIPNLEQAITRAQMAKICERTIEELDGPQVYRDFNEVIKYTNDYGITLKTPYGDYVGHMYEIGIITGYPDRTFKPNNTLTRAEAVTVIRRVIDASIRKPFVEEMPPMITENDREGYSAYTVSIDIYNKSIESQYKIALEYLSERIGGELASEAVEYAQSKVNWRDELVERVFSNDDFSVNVASNPSEVIVSILVFRK